MLEKDKVPLLGPDIEGLAHLSVSELWQPGLGEPAAPPGRPRPLARSLDVVAVGRLPATVPSLGAVARVPLLGTIDPLLEGEVMHSAPYLIHCLHSCTRHPSIVGRKQRPNM